ncbi:MAG: hypothetical protein NT062_01510 [Proteobacteria bacterium]|nr:hypothetical protein [Pseudomonadota bacterium]
MGLAERDVVGQRAGEQDHVLRDDRDAAAQGVQLELADLGAVDVDRSAIALVQAREELDDGGLAGARRAHDGHGRAARHADVDAAQHRLGAVGEVDVDELDRGRGRGGLHHGGAHRHRRRGRDDAAVRLVGVEQLDDALGRGHRALHDGVLRRQVADGDEELLDVLVEHHDDADRGRRHRAARRDVDDDADGDRADRLDDRVHGRVRPDLPEVGVAVARVDLVVLALGDLAAPEELDDADAGQVLLRERVHGGEAHADLAERRAHEAAGVLHEDHQHRQGRERDEGQLHVDRQHHDDDREHLHEVRDQRDRALREHLVDALDVVRHARHQAPDRDPVEERRAELEDVIERGDAQRVHRPLAGELEEPRLAERRQPLRGDERHEHRGVERQRAGIAAEHVVLERVLEQLRLQQLERDRERHEHRPRDEQAPVRPDVAPQPLDQADVVGAAGDDVGLGARGGGRAHDATSCTSSMSSWLRYSCAYSPASRSSWSATRSGSPAGHSATILNSGSADSSRSTTRAKSAIASPRASRPVAKPLSVSSATWRWR